jgi:hypothetical protein
MALQDETVEASVIMRVRKVATSEVTEQSAAVSTSLLCRLYDGSDASTQVIEYLGEPMPWQEVGWMSDAACVR